MPIQKVTTEARRHHGQRPARSSTNRRLCPAGRFDYEPNDAPGAHYEEANGSSVQLAQEWLTNLNASIEALP